MHYFITMSLDYERSNSNKHKDVGDNSIIKDKKHERTRSTVQGRLHKILATLYENIFHICKLRVT
jgi:regulator of replication initiation timing